MKLRIHLFLHSSTQLIYSYFYYCQKHKIKMDIEIDKSVHYNCVIIEYQGKTLFFDYSDDTVFCDDPVKFDFYFKRSLPEKDRKGNVHPVNFNFALAYNSLSFLTKMNLQFFKDKQSRLEILRALDVFDWFTNNSHASVDIKNYPSKVEDKGGTVIFHSRLWDPDRTSLEDEKERRRLQNDFRINACRIIRKNFKNSSVGLFPDELSIKLAPDVLLNKKQTGKRSYFEKMLNSNIGVADDGLKDTPGWKIGEYVLSGKAVISTPLNIAVDEFYDGKNFMQLSHRSAYEELPEKIDALLQGKRYLEMGEENLKWSREYIHPSNYLERIFALVRNEN
ncbi:MAG: hypothetical protein QM710_12070 [Flavobacterium sp.]